MKLCSVCRIEKDITEFHKKTLSKDGHASTCKGCRKIYIRVHYKNDKKYYIEKAVEAKKRARDKISKLKDRPCIDCRKSFPAVCMDFDHVRGEKDFTISQVIGTFSEERVLREVAKCDLVCSNCHRIRTANRLRVHSIADNAALS